MADPDQTETTAAQASTDQPKATAKKGAMPVLRAHAAWVDHLGLGIRVEAGELMDWADERAQRLFRACLGWQAFSVEFIDLPAGKAAAAAVIADDQKRIAELNDQVAKLTARLEAAQDDVAKAVGEQTAELQKQFAEAQALADERAKQVAELQGKLQAAIAGEAPKV